jgi:hypothetical protein
MQIFSDEFLWDFVGIFTEPDERLAVLTSDNEKRILGGCKIFKDYREANEKLSYYQDEQYGEKLLYGYIKTARGGKNFEMAIRHTIFYRVDYMVAALARKAKTFEEIYIILYQWKLKCNSRDKLNFSERVMARILYKKAHKMINTSERRKRMSQLEALNNLLGYSY